MSHKTKHPVARVPFRALSRTGRASPLGGARARRLLPIGDLARELAITPRTIRFYESCGLIHPARRGTARVFGTAEHDRLAFIVRAKNLGLSLEDIREQLAIIDQAERTSELRALKARCERQIKLLDAKRSDLAAALRELRRVRARLTARIARRHGPGG